MLNKNLSLIFQSFLYTFFMPLLCLPFDSPFHFHPPTLLSASTLICVSSLPSSSTRNKYMQLQSDMSSMQCRTRDMMVCQGAEVSGAAVSLNNVSSRLRSLIAKLVQDYSITEADLEVWRLLLLPVYLVCVSFISVGSEERGLGNRRRLNL